MAQFSERVAYKGLQLPYRQTSQVALLKQVKGVGTLIALTHVLYWRLTG
jgi:hypothetical protein